MTVSVHDHRDEAAGWLRADDPVEAFTAWLEEVPAPVRVAFSLLPVRPGDERWDELVGTCVGMLRRAAGLETALDDTAVVERVEGAVRRVCELVDVTGADVEAHVLVGLGASNACQGYWDGTGLTFVFVEQFLPPQPPLPLLGLGPQRLGLWTAHELGHALRYSLPSTASLVPERCAVDDPFDFWAALDRLPLAERFLDEGLATRLSAAAYPDADATDVLYMTPHEIRWLRDHATTLLVDRRRRWSLTDRSPDPAWVAEALHPAPDREGELSLARPPGRWGYYVGAEVLLPPTIGSWEEALRGSTGTSTAS